MLQPSKTNDTESASDHNLRVAQAIKTYCRFPHSQGFALMVDGPWGSGKTHLVKSLMDVLAEQDSLEPLRKPLYVSLYAVKDAGEIGDQIYQQLHPVLGHKYTRLLWAVARGSLRATLKIDLTGDHHSDAALSTQIPELKLSDIAGGAAQRVVIFDDFERAVMTPAELLGFINPLVEHESWKVLILANEAEVYRSDDYAKRKEKTVGSTLRMRADARSALEAFLPEVDDKGAREYLLSTEKDILAVFNGSGLDNLRLLKQFVWIFEKFWLTLTKAQRAHRGATREFVLLLCAATLELRSGRTPSAVFKRADINHFMSIRNKDPEPDVLTADAMFKRYPTVSFEGTLLAPETVREIVLDAAFPAHTVQRQLQGHPFFAQPNDIPSWRALWHSSELQAAELASALAKFQQDFDNRAFRAAGEVLHVAGLCLWMSDVSQPEWGAGDIMARLHSYVEDAFASDEGWDGTALSPLDRMAGGAFGLGFVNQGDQRLKEVACWIEGAAETRRRKAYPEIAAQLHRLMSEDSEAFLRDVCFTNNGPSRYARSAVLPCIPAREFAATLAGITRRDQEQVAMALSIRYDQLPGEPELQSELPWLAEVVNEVERIAAELPPIPRHHLSKLLEHHVRNHIQQPPS
ncbi:MAG TPA: P-loop NTPase fold protein [Stellaceae bacterium]|nr:P-loop NTPase fold protein [Stellaceae bacterium]